MVELKEQCIEKHREREGEDRKKDLCMPYTYKTEDDGEYQ